MRPKSVFHIGELVRYRKGATALMRIESVYDYGGKIGRRFEGSHITGCHHEAYESDCVKPSQEDLRLWDEYRGDRCAPHANWNSSTSGAL